MVLVCMLVASGGMCSVVQKLVISCVYTKVTVAMPAPIITVVIYPFCLMFCASMHGACSFSAHLFVDTIMNLVIESLYSVAYSVVLCSFDYLL